MFLLLLSVSWAADDALVAQGTTINWENVIDDDNVFIVTSDGVFHFFNIFTGEEEWSLPTGGSVFSSLASDGTHYVPSIDGYLFTHMEKYGLSRIPMPIRNLVFFAPFRTECGEIFASSKSTQLFFIDPATGRLESHIKSNSTIPSHGPKDISKDRMLLVRVDYELVQVGEHTDVIKYSEFDVIMNPSKDKPLHQAQVVTSFTGHCTFSVNGTVTAQFKMDDMPSYVFSSKSKFDFELKDGGLALPSNKLFFAPTRESIVAFPSIPLHTPSKIEILMSGLPALPGRKGKYHTEQFLPGMQTVGRAFTDFLPLNSELDPRRPAAQMTDQFQFLMIPRMFIPFKNTAAAIFVTYTLLRSIEYVFIYLSKIESTYHHIVVDPDDPNKGLYGTKNATIVYTDLADKSFLELSELFPINGFVNLLALEEKTDGFLLAYQPLQLYDFSKNFDTGKFLVRVLQCLYNLQSVGFSHGSLDESAFFVDNDGNPIIGRLERSCHPGFDSEDIYALGMLVKRYDTSKDNILIDLLDEMTAEDPEERPYLSEIQRHPYFWQAKTRLDLLSTASEFIFNRDNRNVFSVFEAGASSVLHHDGWMRHIDASLLDEALSKREYADDSLRDLIRLIRNKVAHFNSMPDAVKAKVGYTYEEFFSYFDSLFPNLFLYTYYFMEHYGVG